MSDIDISHKGLFQGGGSLLKNFAHKAATFGCVCALGLAACFAGQAKASGTCQDAGIFSGRMFSNICWECILPMVIGGLKIGEKRVGTSWNPNKTTTGTMPLSHAPITWVPPWCTCPSPNPYTGFRAWGIRVSFWEPFRLLEFVRESGCMQVLGGMSFPFDKIYEGDDQTVNEQDEEKESPITFRHYHYYSYPIMTMLQMWMPKNCNPGMFSSLDVMYVSEIDPTWDHDEIAFFTHPEAALLASPFAVLACIPDTFMCAIGHPMNTLFWCSGSWGGNFPTTGNTKSQPSIWSSTSIMSTRLLYQLHRRGVEWRTVGQDAMCGGVICPYLPKEQYRFSVFHPVAETQSNHTLGELSLIWGMGREIPVTGEDPVYVVWRWLDCCATYID